MAYPSDGEPLKRRILTALVTALEAIEPPDYFSIVSRVLLYEGKPVDVPIPAGKAALVLYPFTAVEQSVPHGVVSYDWPMAVFCGLRQEGGDWPTTIERLMADVQHAIRSNDQLGGIAVDCEPTSSQTEDATPTRPVVSGRVDLRVRFRHLYLNPSVVGS